jgi:hypothetical protein
MPDARKIFEVAKDFGRAIKKNSVASEYINRAVKWGAISGAVGGAVEWSGGGSFFEGAKSGAFKGALAGAGYTAWRAGKGLSSNPVASAAAVAPAAKKPKYKYRKVSKQVTAINRVPKNPYI